MSIAQLEWTLQDTEQIVARGLTLDEVSRQLRHFQNGYPAITLDRPCTIGDGITCLSADRYDELERVCCAVIEDGRALKFVPASGAGSRMFKYLSAIWHQNSQVTRTDLERDAETDEDAASALQFFENLPQYAFYSALSDAMGKENLEADLSVGRYAVILNTLLSEDGLNYPNLPKGVLPFHRYSTYSRTPIEEHLVESIAYVRDRNNVAHIHFTVSQEHLEGVRHHIEAIRGRYEMQGIRLDITLSVQKDETDTIAVDLDNEPFRDRDGRLVFRAGGHGALLENLNDLTGDIIFIKNIDNIIPEEHIESISLHKRLLGGLLVEIQTQIFGFLKKLHEEEVELHTLDEVEEFLQHTLCITAPYHLHDRRAYLIDRLNRPIRVCGIVKNTGAPGGGPFWVQHADGTQSLQIVESAQVDTTSDEQQAVFQKSTHFSPVDLVCGVRDYKGQPFDLRKFRDPDTGFISSKSFEGVPLKAMEHPGLWNGSMAEWNTVFVEVPGFTFNPVKTIDDIIRPEHQPSDP